MNSNFQFLCIEWSEIYESASKVESLAHADPRSSCFYARFERFKAKARAFLKEHESHIAIHKLRMNEPLTPTDLAELEQMFATSGVGEVSDVQRAKKESQD